MPGYNFNAEDLRQLADDMTPANSPHGRAPYVFVIWPNTQGLAEAQTKHRAASISVPALSSYSWLLADKVEPQEKDYAIVVTVRAKSLAAAQEKITVK